MLLLRFKTFLKSLFFHVWRGFPKTTQKEIFDRYSICIDCDKFNRNKEECSVCGCSINKKRQFFNKLAWADQECPEGKWNKINR